jgi:hypothetical protein
MPPLRRRFAPLLVLLQAVTLQAVAEPQTLRVDWQPGKAYVLETETNSTTMAGGAQQEMAVKQGTEMEVTAMDDGSREVRVTFARVHGEMKGPNGSAKFDTDNPEASEPELLKSVAATLGRAFVLKYDQANRFVDSRDVSMEVNPDQVAPSLSEVADRRAAANLFRKSMEMGLPPGPVQLGDSWTADETLTFPKAGDTQVKLSGKYASNEELQGRKHAKITFDGVLKSTDMARGSLPAGFAISDKSKLSGVVFYDLERRVISMSVSTTQLHLIVEDQAVQFEQKVTTRLDAVLDIRRAIPIEDDEYLNKE